MATEKFAYLYVQDTLSDWEAGYAVAELNSGRFFKVKGQRIPVKTVGITRDSIITMGGVAITPDATVEEVTAESSAMLIVVGGDTWQDPKHQPIIEKVKELLDAGANVAAICGATTALANAGIFDNRPHTSNTLEYLKMVAPNYKGDAHYQDEKAVMDGNLITANSAGSLLFAKHILERLEVFSDDALEAWYNYFETGEAKYFFNLMNALPKS
jgi:putative intracellular protease/amidase